MYDVRCPPCNTVIGLSLIDFFLLPMNGAHFVPIGLVLSCCMIYSPKTYVVNENIQYITGNDWFLHNIYI